MWRWHYKLVVSFIWSNTSLVTCAAFASWKQSVKNPKVCNLFSLLLCWAMYQYGVTWPMTWLLCCGLWGLHVCVHVCMSCTKLCDLCCVQHLCPLSIRCAKDLQLLNLSLFLSLISAFPHIHKFVVAYTYIYIYISAPSHVNTACIYAHIQKYHPTWTLNQKT